jgi:hypothetical protein
MLLFLLLLLFILLWNTKIEEDKINFWEIIAIPHWHVVPIMLLMAWRVD